MKYIIEIPDKDISKYALSDELSIPVQIGMSEYSIGIGTGLKLTPYSESEAEQARKEGQDEAWELAGHLYNVHPDVTKAIYQSMNGGKGCGVAFEMSFAEARDEYEAWKKEKEEIHVGDEVEIPGCRKMIVFDVDNMNGISFGTITNDVYCVDWSSLDRKKLKKTGRHFDTVEKLLQEMKGKQNETK